MLQASEISGRDAASPTTGRSIATFVIVTLVLVATVLLGGLGAVNYVSDRRAQRERLATDVAARADQLAAALALPLWNFDRPQIEKVLEIAMRAPEVEGVEVRMADVSAPDGVAVYSMRRAADGAVVRGREALREPDGMLVELRPVRARESELGRTTVVVSPRFVEASLRDELRSLATQIVALDALLVGILWGLLRRMVMRPLQAVERFASSVSDEGRRHGAGTAMEGQEFYGEFGSVAASLRRMVALLDARYEAVQKGQATLAGILDAAPQGIFWKDPEGVYLGCNAVFARLAGLARPREVIGKTDYDLPWPRQNTEKYLADDREVIESGRPMWHLHESLHVPGGETIHLETTKVPLTDESGRVRAVLGVFEDVTKRRKSEEALTRARAFTEAIIDSIPGVLCLYDDELRLVRWNAKAVEITGYTPAELTARRLGEGQAPEDKARIMAAVERLKAEGHAEVEAPLVTKSGERIPFFYTGVRLVVDGKTYVVGIGIDIRDRKAAEEALQRETAFTQALFDNVPAVMSVYDETGKLIRWNRKLREVTGQPEEVLAKRYVGDAQPAEERSRIAEAAKRILEAGYVTMEASLMTAGGERVPFFYTGVPVQLDGKPHILTIGVDITERKRAEAVLLESEKMRTIAGLAAGMAHEINNPLAGMLQNAQVVLSRVRPELPANQATADRLGTTVETVRAYMRERGILEMLESVRSSGERAAEIVANMLSFSRGGIEPQSRREDVRELLDGAIDLASSDYDFKKFDFRNIRVTREYAEDLPPVPCRGTEIQQVVLNLLKNAAQAMNGRDNGGGPPAVVVRAKRAARDRVRVEVEDNGPGMPESVRHQVFEPFFTTKGPQDGSGLGLFVSYCIVTRNHGGEIAVESNEGKGTKFVIDLPVNGTAGHKGAAP